MGLCVCVEPKVSNEKAQGFLHSSLVRCFFFCIDISCWLFFWEALKPKTCAPLSRTERWLFVEFLFVSEATATIKLFWVKWFCVFVLIWARWWQHPVRLPRSRCSGEAASEAAWEWGRTCPSSNTEGARAGFFSVLLRDTVSPSSPTPACLSTHGGFGVLPNASEQKADEAGGTDTSAKSLPILCSLPARGVEGERCQRAELETGLLSPAEGCLHPVHHCCWAEERLQGPGQG